MTTLLVSFNGTRENGQFLGDQIVSLKTAYLFAQNTPNVSKILLAMSPQNELHFLWQKFIDTYQAEVVYDAWHPGDMPSRWENWTKWRNERNIEGRPFDVYRELYRRIDGSHRQSLLCGGEIGLGKKNIFEYFYYGQENFKYGQPITNDPVIGIEHFGDELIYHDKQPADRGVYIAPHAKCQGNAVFTMSEFWPKVIHQLIGMGITVTVNYDGNFCEELSGNPLYRKIFPDFKGMRDEICRHKIIACGNTGVGWMAFACGTPVIAMQPENSNMPDYRYELCGCKSLVEIVEQPDADYVARRISEEVNRVVVLTTGCFDVVHSGHIRHLEESRSHGTRLIVALNSDASVKALKGDGRPLNNQEQRASVLSAIRYVDEVRIFDGADAMPLIRDLKPMVLTNGCDHDRDSIVGKDFVESYGGKVVVTSGTRDQSSTKIIAAVAIKPHDVLKAIQDASAVSINPVDKLRLLAKEFQSVSHLPGDVADLGAYRGGCSLILRRLAPQKHLHVFDTWSGTPVDDPLCHHKKGCWPASLDECKAIVGVSVRTHYWQGVFPSFMQNSDAASEEELAITHRQFCFTFIDPDTYESVRAAIEFFWPRIVRGGKLVFDDYGWEPCAGVKKAVDEVFAEDSRMIYPQLHTCVVVKR